MPRASASVHTLIKPLIPPTEDVAPSSSGIDCVALEVATIYKLPSNLVLMATCMG